MQAAEEDGGSWQLNSSRHISDLMMQFLSSTNSTLLGRGLAADSNWYQGLSRSMASDVLWRADDSLWREQARYTSYENYANETFTEFLSPPVPEALAACLAVTSHPQAWLHFGQTNCFVLAAAHYAARLKQILQDGLWLYLHHRNVDYEDSLAKALETLPALSPYLDMLGALCVT